MTTTPRPQDRLRPARAWAFFLFAFAAGLALVAGSTLVRYNQHTTIVTATLRPGEHVDLGGWRFSVAQPLAPVDTPGSFQGQGIDGLGNRIDQEGATWWYAEIIAEPLPGIDLDVASCSLQVRAGQDRWDGNGLVDQPVATFCGWDGFPDGVGVPRHVGGHFQLPTDRLADDPYLVVVVPGFPARALAVEGS